MIRFLQLQIRVYLLNKSASTLKLQGNGKFVDIQKLGNETLKKCSFFIC